MLQPEAEFAPVSEYLPAAQSMQAPRPAVLYLPAAQSWQTLAELAPVPVDAENLPALHA